MRMSELSRAAEVPIATVKYYQREGLLPPGEATSRNQVDYDDVHVRRLRLIRVLREVGGLGVAQVGAVLEAIDDSGLPGHRLLGVAQHALGPPSDSGPVPDDVARARADIDRLVADLGWNVSAEAPARRALADALVSLRRLGRNPDPSVFLPLAHEAAAIAERELGTIERASGRAEAVEGVVVGTVVFEAALVALRRLAHEHYSSLRSKVR